MPTEKKKKTKEDTWTPSDLKKTIPKGSSGKSQTPGQSSSKTRKSEDGKKTSKVVKDEHDSRKRDDSRSRHKDSEKEKRVREKEAKERLRKEEERRSHEKIENKRSKEKIKVSGDSTHSKKEVHRRVSHVFEEDELDRQLRKLEERKRRKDQEKLEEKVQQRNEKTRPKTRKSDGDLKGKGIEIRKSHHSEIRPITVDKPKYLEAEHSSLRDGSHASEERLLKQLVSGGTGDTAPKEDTDNYDYDNDEFEDYDDDFEDDGDEESSNSEHEINNEDKEEKQNSNVNEEHESSHDSEEQSQEESDKKDEIKSEELSEENEADLVEERNEEVEKSFKQAVPLQRPPRELEEIRRAITAENQQYNLSKQKTIEPSSLPQDSIIPSSLPQHHSFINFSSAKKRVASAKTSSHIKKRGKELLHLIDLDIVSIELLDIAPLKEYDLYMRSFGRSNTQQAYIQTNEDNIDKDVQTDDIISAEKWSQHPADSISVCGGTDHDTDDLNADLLLWQDLDSIQFNQFLHAACQVMVILLEEESLEKEEIALTRNRSPAAISEGFVQLKSPSFLKDREIIFVYFSSVQPNVLVTIHRISKLPSYHISVKSIMCIWNVYEASRPQKILISSSRCLACCLSPFKTSLVFAGMADGSLAAWDLREPATMHSYYQLDGEDWLLRSPTYNTAWLLYSNHQSPVTFILPVISTDEGFQNNMSKEGLNSGLSFQLASLEKEGIIHFWTVVEISKSDSSGSLEDFGISPNGKIKLVKSSSLDLNIFRGKIVKDFIQVFQMQLNPMDPNHLYIGTGQGYVLHAIRYGGKVYPKMYQTKRDSPKNVMSIDFSPFLPDYFLVGCDDGSIRIHSIHSEYPIISWPNSAGGEKLFNAQWSCSRPGVFYVLYNQSKLHTWDLTEREDEPIRLEHFTAGRVTCFGLSHVLGTSHWNHSPLMVACFDTSQIEVHRLKEEFRQAKSDEVIWLQRFLEDREP